MAQTERTFDFSECSEGVKANAAAKAKYEENPQPWPKQYRSRCAGCSRMAIVIEGKADPQTCGRSRELRELSSS